jgi:hypothetical protein
MKSRKGSGEVSDSTKRSELASSTSNIVVSAEVAETDDARETHDGPAAPPGWYERPEEAGRNGYWDGKRWVPREELLCSACGAQLSGPFCAQCGVGDSPS